MGASRESQNIFICFSRPYKKHKLKRAWYLIKNFNKITFGDTFGPTICKVIGHKPYRHPFFDPNVYACRTCNRYVPMPTPNEIDAALYDKEVEAYALSPIKLFFRKLKKHF